MELVPGESLAHLLLAERERGIAADPRVVAWVGAEIASALHHAHTLSEAGAPLPVIHRDVSPQNLLLGFDGAAKLIDFGVARCAQLSDATRSGTVRGKLAYASPEQLGARPLDGRSDLFSLAVVLHEWLAGRPLFACDNDAATLQSVLAAEIPPLPRAPRLGLVLARALARAARAALSRRRSLRRGAARRGRWPPAHARAPGGGAPARAVPGSGGALAGDRHRARRRRRARRRAARRRNRAVGLGARRPRWRRVRTRAGARRRCRPRLRQHQEHATAPAPRPAGLALARGRGLRGAGRRLGAPHAGVDGDDGARGAGDLRRRTLPPRRCASRPTADRRPPQSRRDDRRATRRARARGRDDDAGARRRPCTSRRRRSAPARHTTPAAARRAIVDELEPSPYARR